MDAAMSASERHTDTCHPVLEVSQCQLGQGGAGLSRLLGVRLRLEAHWGALQTEQADHQA